MTCVVHGRVSIYRPSATRSSNHARDVRTITRLTRRVDYWMIQTDGQTARELDYSMMADSQHSISADYQETV